MLIRNIIFTYIRWPLQPFSKDYWHSFSHQLCCVCYFLYINGITYSLKLSSNDRFFWETFHGNYIYSQSFCQKYAVRKFPKKYFLHFILISSLIRVIRIIYKYYKYFFNLWNWMSRRMNQTYFECCKFDANVVRILFATCSEYEYLRLFS